MSENKKEERTVGEIEIALTPREEFAFVLAGALIEQLSQVDDLPAYFNRIRSDALLRDVDQGDLSRLERVARGETSAPQKQGLRRFGKQIHRLLHRGESDDSRYLELLRNLVNQLQKPHREALSTHPYFHDLLIGARKKEKLLRLRDILQTGVLAELDQQDLRSLAKYAGLGPLAPSEGEEGPPNKSERSAVDAETEAKALTAIWSIVSVTPKRVREKLYLEMSRDLARLLTRREFAQTDVAAFTRDDRYAYIPAYFGQGGRKATLLWDIPVFGPLATRIVESGNALLSYDRLYVIYTAFSEAVRRLEDAAGVVEIGVYKGGTSQFLAALTALHPALNLSVDVYDTFEGHAKLDIGQRDLHSVGQFDDTSLSHVQGLLAPYSNARVHKGRAQDNFDSLPERIALAHLDTDLYEPTRECLPVLFSRLTRGGAIVVDDYGSRSCPGIEQAVADFAAARTDAYVFPLQTGQCLVLAA